MSSKHWTIWLVIIPSIGLVLAAWLLSRWQPLAGCDVKIENNTVKAIEMRTGK